MTDALRALMIGCVVLIAAARADQVVFQNGDRLTGKIETAADGKLTLQSRPDLRHRRGDRDPPQGRLGRQTQGRAGRPQSVRH